MIEVHVSNKEEVAFKLVVLLTLEKGRSDEK